MWRLLALAMAVGLVGCAGYNAKGVDYQEDEESAAGIRYYQPAKFLLIHTDNKGNVTSKWLTLPDVTQKMSIKPFSFMSSNNMTLTFTNGMLDHSVIEVDQTAVPKAVIASLEKAAKAAFGAGVFLAPKVVVQPEKVPAPYLFKLVKTQSEWKLVGGQGVGANDKEMMIEVKVTNPGKTEP